MGASACSSDKLLVFSAGHAEFLKDGSIVGPLLVQLLEVLVVIALAFWRGWTLRAGASRRRETPPRSKGRLIWVVV